MEGAQRMERRQDRQIGHFDLPNHEYCSSFVAPFSFENSAYHADIGVMDGSRQAPSTLKDILQSRPADHPERARTGPEPMKDMMTAYLSHLTDAFRRWNTRRKTVATLLRLDERQLDDIGIARGDIEEIAAYQARIRVARQRAQHDAARAHRNRNAVAPNSASLVGCG
ncbi:MAG: DUF1127 domain-containing protein [Dongiaceae bacterium]